MQAFTARPISQSTDLVAHTPGRHGAWHSLSAHSRAVGEMAAEFAGHFGGGDLARLVGYLHDAGKATDVVQRRLCALGASNDSTRERLGEPHKIDGAVLAATLLQPSDERLMVAGYLAIHGHHSGIPSWSSSHVPRSNIKAGLQQKASLDPLLNLMGTLVNEDLSSIAAACELPRGRQVELRDLTHIELFTRLVHSALVDADFLDTAAHFDDRAPWSTPTHGMARLRDEFMSAHAREFAEPKDSEVNRLRRLVFDACLAAATEQHGPAIYRLPAPTGTGKTVASAAFALHHAARFGKRRVIVAVPFTTITTQNAAVYRRMLGGLEHAVLEHHSDIIDPQIADDTWRRLSAPQWDGEFIVTTTVQLFESLFSNRPSRTRKLHRIVNSVIVLDEVQSLPVALLAPILCMLRELTERYGVTVLLASATQPSFWALPFWEGLLAHDILPVDSVPDVAQRVTYQLRPGRPEWAEIAAEVGRHPQCLTVVNTRRAADELFELVRDQAEDPGSVYLLSRSLTSEHRRRILDDVTGRLKSERPVQLVSTQLIEAGVDIDFPIVFRALAPADSVVQAAGRCNRNGESGPRGGTVVVFNPVDGGLPPGDYGPRTETTRSHFIERPDQYRFDDPTSIDAYYREVYAHNTQIDQSAAQFATLRRQLDFADTDKAFQMIPDDPSLEVVVLDHPDDATATALQDAVAALRANPLLSLDAQTRRLLSRHSASVSRRDIGLTEELPQGIRVWCGEYDRRRGAVSNGGLTW